MQYHWVVYYDQETHKFEIDWDLTYHALDGVVYNPADAFRDYAWSMPTDDQEIMFEEYSKILSEYLDIIRTI
jgi:hypothetical protein